MVKIELLRNNSWKLILNLNFATYASAWLWRQLDPMLYIIKSSWNEICSSQISNGYSGLLNVDIVMGLRVQYLASRGIGARRDKMRFGPLLNHGTPRYIQSNVEFILTGNRGARNTANWLQFIWYSRIYFKGEQMIDVFFKWTNCEKIYWK